MNTRTLQSTWPVHPIDLSETRAILGELFNGREHWLMIFHWSAAPLLIELERNYYAGEKNSDFTLIAHMEGGEVFGIVAARKKHLASSQLVSILHQFTDARLS